MPGRRPLPTVLPASGKPAYLGMWTWLVQRASSAALIVLLPWHWLDPSYRPVRVAVLGLVVFHAIAGIRVMLTDVGVGERWPRGLLWMLAGGGLVVFVFFLQYA
jgi:succinate dehydrogenase/fumarate reductase cytochrome b subunit